MILRIRCLGRSEGRARVEELRVQQFRSSVVQVFKVCEIIKHENRELKIGTAWLAVLVLVCDQSTMTVVPAPA
jgi:hypothetical protein